MCYYRLFIFLGCGHSTFASTPVRYCANARGGRGTTKSRRRKSRQKELSPTQSLDLLRDSSVYSSMEQSLQDEQVDIKEPPETTQPPQPPQPENATEEPGLTRIIEDTTTGEDVQPCLEGRAHPIHTVKLERICAVCEYEREERLRALDTSVSEIKFEPWRWQWKYQGGNKDTLKKSDKAANSSESRAQDPKGSGVWGMGQVVGEWMSGKDKKDSVIEPS